MPVAISSSHATIALERGESKLWAILVGVNQYGDSSLPPLRYSALDCQGLGHALAEATQAFPHKELAVYHDFGDRAPTIESVRQALQQAIAAAEPRDTLLVYFSGHGILNRQQAVLCLADTQKHDLAATGLGLQELLSSLDRCAARQQLIWLDACHSGGMTLRGAQGRLDAPDLPDPTPQLVATLQERAQQHSGLYALLSCDRDQQSWEFPELGHGVFTYFLMRGLRGEAADAQGTIDADSLYKYVYHQTLRYIDKTNQQIRLVNQQKCSRGDTQLQFEYPLQTPKRIVEGVGELVLGLRSQETALRHPRQALIVEGLTGSQTPLALGKALRGSGGFDVEYWPRLGGGLEAVRGAIRDCLAAKNGSSDAEAVALTREPSTVLLYLRGRIEISPEGDASLVLGSDVRLSRSWLRHVLQRSRTTQQIIILDCPGASGLQEWIDELQVDPELGQCLIAAAAPPTEPHQFADALFATLKEADPKVGLPAAGWIAQLQTALAGTSATPLTWLSGTQGVIEVLPGQLTRGNDREATFDLGLCPFMGLRAFGEENAQYFFGREALTQAAIAALNQQTVLAVVGASGSGKSSVMQAGVLAQLRQGKQVPGSDRWWLGCLRPGADPLKALVQRLADPGPDSERTARQLQLEGLLYRGEEGFVQWLRSRPEPMVVLAVDQFEELFTLATPGDRLRFLDLLFGAIAHAGDRFKLVFSLRADFVSAGLEIPELAQILQRHSLLVPPYLSEADYRQVILGPAEQVGLRVEPGLTDILLQDIQHAAGDLPLLQFVLEQLWENRENGTLTVRAYRHLGGLKGALERRAQEVYDGLDKEAQACARWLFLALTQLGDGTEDTRRRVIKSDLMVAKFPRSLVEQTLQVLTAAKLVVVGLDGEVFPARSRSAEDELPESSELFPPDRQPQVTVELAHEALIRHWSTLRWWLEENRAYLHLLRQLEQAAALWQQKGRQTDFLLQGTRLAEAEELYVKYADELAQDVQLFFEACLDERQRQQQQAKRQLRRAQTAAAIIGLLGLVASGFGGMALLQRQKAQANEVETLASLADTLLLSHQPLEALVAGTQAGTLLQQMFGMPANDAVKTATTLQQVMDSAPEVNRLEGHRDTVHAVSYSPDGGTMATGSWDGTIRLWRADGSLLQTLEGKGGEVMGLNFSPDGQTLAAATMDGIVRLWGLDGSLLKTFGGHRDGVTDVRFSPDGRTLASASYDGTVRLWGLNGQPLHTLKGHTDGVTAIAFSPDGKTLASASMDATVRLWRTGGSLLKVLKGHDDYVTDVRFSPDGRSLASASMDKTIRLWNAEGTSLRTLSSPQEGLTSIAFSPDGRTLAAGSHDRTVTLWQVNDGTLLATWQRHGDWVTDVSFSPDGRSLASASADKTVSLWQWSRPHSWHEGGVYSVAFSPDGATLATASFDTTAKLWNRADGTLLRTLKGHDKTVESLSFSPDGRVVATASADGTAKLWQVNDGTLLQTFAKGDRLKAIQFSPDGQLVATAGADGTAKLWQVSDGSLRQTLKGHTDSLSSLDFSPDGQTLATGSWDGTIRLWQTDGSLLQTLEGKGGEVMGLSFSPNGRTLAVGNWDNTITLWRMADYSPIRTLAGHSGGVTSLNFSPDGEMLASGSADGTVKLWQAGDGTLIQTSIGHSDRLRSVAFSPDGKTLASASDDATVELWTLDLDDLLARSCDRLQDYLTSHPAANKGDRQICR